MLTYVHGVCCLFFRNQIILYRSQSNRGSTQLHTNAVLEFEERLEAIKEGLSQGVDCFVWEGELLICTHREMRRVPRVMI